MVNPEDYTIGWICALTTEYVAAQLLLDKAHEERIPVSPNYQNTYKLGSIGYHNVVIATLPHGEYGTASAARVAADMVHTFHNIRIGLMVGIGGGAPDKKNDIRLGDIAVSSPSSGNGGVLQYDFGKTVQDQEFRITGFLNQPPTVRRAAVTEIEAQYEINGHHIDQTIEKILEERPRLRKKYGRPDPDIDWLFKSDAKHPSGQEKIDCSETCSDDSSNLVHREQRMTNEDNPAVHYGLIASGNQPMKDAALRDKLIADKGVLCIEMEAAGLMNHFPCLVIRGICDYSDTHKNDSWQGYAAMVAAAYAKDLIYCIHPTRIEAEKKIADIISSSQ